MRLRTKFLLVLLGVFLVLGTMIVGSVQLFQQQTETRAQQDIDETARLAAQQIDESLEDTLDSLESHGSAPPANLSADSGPYLFDLINDSAFSIATYTDSEGTIRDVRGVAANSPVTRADIIGTDESEEPYFERALANRSAIAEPTVESDGRVTVLFAAEIIQNGSQVGVVAAVTTVYDPTRATQPRTAGGLFSSLPALNTSEQTPRVVQPSSDSDIVLAGARAQFSESIVSQATSTRTGWRVVVERDRSTLVDQLQLLQYAQFGSLFVVLALLFGLGFYEYRTNLRQTDRLLAGFDELGQANFEHSMELSAAKEWEQISEGFNTMTDGLREREVELRAQQQELKAREQRLSVLNRVLRHNLQNDMTVIQGHAELVRAADTDDRLTDAADKIIEKSDGLVNHGKKARRLETVMEHSSEGTEPIDVAEETAEIVRTYAAEYPDVTVHASVPDSAPVSAVVGVEFGIESLVENAFEHNTSDQPEVWVSVDQADSWVEVDIRDNGPGIPAHEREVLERDEESSLEHGSGIGLWLAYWAIENSGGEIQFPDHDGGFVRVRLPAVTQ